MISNSRTSKIYLFLIFVFGLIIFDGYRLKVGNLLSIKPFLVVSLILVIWVIRKNIFVPSNFKYFLLWYASLFIPLICGTVLSWSQFLVILSGQLILTFFYISFYNYFIYFRLKLIDIFDSIVFLGIFVSLIGFIQVFMFFLGVNIGVSHFEDVGVPRPESFFSETDWHAMFIGYSLLASLLIPTHSRFYKKKDLIVFFLFCSLVLSFGRTALVGAIVSFVIFKFCFQSVRASLNWVFKFIVIGIPLLILFIILAPESIVDRFNIIGNILDPEMDAGAINSRLFAINMTLDYIYQNPFTGNGAGSLNFLAYDEHIREVYAYGGGINSGRGGTNIFLTALFDSGVSGLIVMLIFFFVLFKENWKYIKENNEFFGYFLKFCFLSNIYFLVECQANNMIRTPVCWVNFTMLAYALFLCRQKKIDLG
jgi:O-antigen ligase